MGKYNKGNDLDFLCAIANELAEANRLKRLEMTFSALKEGVKVDTLKQGLQDEA